MTLPPEVTERYESLRTGVLQADRGDEQGWVLLMQCGLLAWARACREHSPKAPIEPLSPSVAVIPDQLSAPLIQVLAGMVLHLQQEIAHGF